MHAPGARHCKAHWDLRTDCDRFQRKRRHFPSYRLSRKRQSSRCGPRLKSLNGKTIALVGGSFMANVTPPELKRLILAEFQTAKVYLLSEIGSARPWPRPGDVGRRAH